MSIFKNILLVLSVVLNGILFYSGNVCTSFYQTAQANWKSTDDLRANDLRLLEALLVDRLDVDNALSLLGQRLPANRYIYDASANSITSGPIDPYRGPTLTLKFATSSKLLSKIWINPFAKNE